MDDNELIAEFIRTIPSDTGVNIQVKAIHWTSPYESETHWVTAAKVRGTPTPERLLERVLRVLKDRKYFRVCKDCSERCSVGQMCTDMGVCHGCAERNHGVAF